MPRAPRRVGASKASKSVWRGGAAPGPGSVFTGFDPGHGGALDQALEVGGWRQIPLAGRCEANGMSSAWTSCPEDPSSGHKPSHVRPGRRRTCLFV